MYIHGRARRTTRLGLHGSYVLHPCCERATRREHCMHKTSAANSCQIHNVSVTCTRNDRLLDGIKKITALRHCLQAAYDISWRIMSQLIHGNLCNGMSNLAQYECAGNDDDDYYYYHHQ